MHMTIFVVQQTYQWSSNAPTLILFRETIQVTTSPSKTLTTIKYLLDKHLLHQHIQLLPLHRERLFLFFIEEIDLA